MADDEQLLVQESTVPIISSAGTSRPAVRLAHFLLPRADGAHLPTLPSPPRNAGPILDNGLQVEFKGWAESPNLWRRWVAKLRPRHESLWRNVGILDAVLATTCRVRRDEGALLQLAAFWSGETNTFVFPWGEATVTLEDVAVLGGLPLFGKSVCAPLQGPLLRDVDALEAVRCALYRSKNQKPSHPAWAKYFLERPPEEEAAAAGDDSAGGLLEHGAFLAMWLSLFVVPAPPFDVVRAQVLPIAARLARGRCVALAPAAVASIYSDLSALKRYFNLGKKYQPFVGWAPFHILQLWVWERFPELRPERATTRDPDVRGVPRAARWHDVHKVFDLRYVHAVFMSPKEFEWRPYGCSSFAPPPEKGGCWVHGRDISRNKRLLSFAQCLRACELVGICCIEQYHPHRVARQLGFDQDVPGTVSRVNSNWIVAWATYNMESENFAFIVPQCKPAVTIEYAQWWEPYSLLCATAVANAAKMKELHVLVEDSWVEIPVVERLNSIIPNQGTTKHLVEVLHDANSRKKQYVHTGMPPPDLVEDSLAEIPVVERLNSTIPNQGTTEHVVEGAESKQIAENVNDFIPRWVRNGAKRAALRKNVNQALFDVAVVLVSAVDESSCVSTTKTEQGKSLQQSKEKAPDLLVMYDEQSRSSEHGEVVLHHLVEGAASTCSNEAVRAATVVDVQSTLEDIMVISDDDFDELLDKDDEVGAMHLKSPQFETSTSPIREPKAERQLVSTRNNELGSPVLNEAMVQSNGDYELSTVLNDIILSQEPAEVTDVTTVQPVVNLLEGATEEMQTCIVTREIDKRDKIDKENLPALEGNENANEDISASTQELESLVEDCIEVNRKSSGNNKSSSSPIDSNTELVSRVICTRTLYYLRPFERVKDDQDRDASGTNTDQGAYQPRREIGTREMIKEAYAARAAEKVELQKVIDCLKEDIAELEVQLRDESPSKT